ncbi:MAG: hydroxyacid dehydrogenase, partial [Roseinatronobacter sp.]
MLTACDTDFLAKLSALLPPDALAAPEPRYLEEPRGRLTGQGGAVALPRSVDEVAAILRACHAARVGVVPYGGGTG